LGQGVLADRAVLVGHALYRLYREPYRRYFESRAALAREFNLDPSKRWVFVPENYRWAFFTDAKLRKLVRRGPEAAALFEMRDYCRRSLTALMQWCDALARHGEVEVIFRPRPATSLKEITAFAGEVFGGRRPGFAVIKDRSARDWVMAADVLASSYSTVLIEGALAGKALVRVAPEPTPEGLRYEWFDLVAGVVDEAEFIAACLAPAPEAAAALRDWAERSFFPAGDPVDRLVQVVADQIEAALAGPAPVRAATAAQPMPAWLGPLASRLPPRLRRALFARFVPGFFFNAETHEKDVFGAAEVERRTVRWRTVLASVGTESTLASPQPGS
jgi:hypothetical protein